MLALRLTIENETSLQDGGPLSITVTGKRGIDIGRDHHLDWVLPDPSRFISGKHCEVRFREGGYWLHDTSTNGTLLNGSATRMTEPRRLRQDDRLEIGRYIVKVEVTEAADIPGPDAPVSRAVDPSQIWSFDDAGIAAPEPVQDFKPRRQQRPVEQDDVLNWAVDMPPPPPAPPVEPPRRREEPAPAAELPPAAVLQPAPPPPSGPASEDPWAIPADILPVPLAGIVQPQAESTPKPQVPLADDAPAETREPPLVAAAPAPPRPAEPERPRLPPAQGMGLANGFDTAPARKAAQGDTDLVLRRFAKGAGLPPELLAGRDAGELAELAGALLLTTTTQLKQLLAARAETKGAMRSAQQTMVQALDNNPIRFCPQPEDAMKVMFGPPNRSYLDARTAFDRSFGDLKTHQVDTFAAMQQALQTLVQQLDPKAIDASLEPEGKLGVFASRKGRLWDMYLARWQTMTAGHERGLLGAFMLHLANAYDRQREKRQGS